MPTAQEEIRARVEAFAATLTALVRGAALEAVGASLGEERRPAATKTAPASRAAAPRPAPAGRRSKGQKRDPQDLAKLTERLFEYVSANPGRTMSVIQAALGVPATALKFPMRKLRAANRIAAKGVKQATTYSAK